jgi:hypothetical protein
MGSMFSAGQILLWDIRVDLRAGTNTIVFEPAKCCGSSLECRDMLLFLAEVAQHAVGALLGSKRWSLAFLGKPLWHSIDRRFIAWGAAGRHISFDVLDRLLAGDPIGRIVGADTMKFAGWQRSVAEYAKQFADETPNWRPQAAQTVN